MQGFTFAATLGVQRKSKFDVKLIKSMDHEIQVKGNESRCMLEGYIKDNYYSRFYSSSYPRCRENQTST